VPLEDETFFAFLEGFLFFAGLVEAAEYKASKKLRSRRRFPRRERFFTFLERAKRPLFR